MGNLKNRKIHIGRSIPLSKLGSQIRGVAIARTLCGLNVNALRKIVTGNVAHELPAAHLCELCCNYGGYEGKPANTASQIEPADEWNG
jgi:hypothetical protein